MRQKKAGEIASSFLSSFLNSSGSNKKRGQMAIAYNRIWPLFVKYLADQSCCQLCTASLPCFSRHSFRTLWLPPRVLTTSPVFGFLYVFIGRLARVTVLPSALPPVMEGSMAARI